MFLSYGYITLIFVIIAIVTGLLISNSSLNFG